MRAKAALPQPEPGSRIAAGMPAHSLALLTATLRRSATSSPRARRMVLVVARWLMRCAMCTVFELLRLVGGGMVPPDVLGGIGQAQPRAADRIAERLIRSRHDALGVGPDGDDKHRRGQQPRAIGTWTNHQIAWQRLVVGAHERFRS
jgi:hypothetical protein